MTPRERAIGWYEDMARTHSRAVCAFLDGLDDRQSDPMCDRLIYRHAREAGHYGGMVLGLRSLEGKYLVPLIMDIRVADEAEQAAP